MKKLFFFLFFICFCSYSYSAEFLVLAESSKDLSLMQKGDIVSIRENGWDWEKTCKRCSEPFWVIIKIPEMTMIEAEKYVNQITEEYTENIDGKDIKLLRVIKKRKYNFLPTEIDSIKFTGKNILTINSEDTELYKSKIIDKSLELTEK